MNTAVCNVGEEQFRIVENIGGFGGTSWTWRWRVERLKPAHKGRFLWWTFDIPERWPAVTDWADYETCQAVIANGGELTRIVP